MKRRNLFERLGKSLLIAPFVPPLLNAPEPISVPPPVLPLPFSYRPAPYLLPPGTPYLMGSMYYPAMFATVFYEGPSPRFRPPEHEADS